MIPVYSQCCMTMQDSRARDRYFAGFDRVHGKKRNPMTETASTTITRSPKDVWEIVGEFGGLDTWMPGIESCIVEGDIRTITTGDMVITERLVSRDPDARRITYSIIGDGAPVASHEATIAVMGDDRGSEVTWAVTTEPTAGEAMFRDIYQGALDQLKKHMTA